MEALSNRAIGASRHYINYIVPGVIAR